jgi:hypothetical protein
MKARMEPLRCPDRPGYLRVPLEGREVHAFRLPTWSEATRLAEFSASRPEAVANHVEYLALLIGVAWHHEARELEAEYPIDDPSPAALIRFARAVERELEEADYTAHDLGTLGRALLDALTTRQRRREAEAAEAARLADFSSPPLDTASSP